MRQIAIPNNLRKVNLTPVSRQRVPLEPKDKFPAPAPAASPMTREMNALRDAAAAVQQLRFSAQRELEMAKQMRAEALRYQRETETRARSQAQQLILRTRLSTQQEIEELIRNASSEIQKVLADIRMIRITAQEELAAQRSFTNAARICSLSLEVQKEPKGPAAKKKKQLPSKN